MTLVIKAQGEVQRVGGIWSQREEFRVIAVKFEKVHPAFDVGEAVFSRCHRVF